jgi:hypothetical protein
MIMKLKKRPGPRGAVEPVKKKYIFLRHTQIDLALRLFNVTESFVMVL